MKNIFIAFAIIVVSSLTFTYNASAQDNPGINPEHMPDFTSNHGDSLIIYTNRITNGPVKKCALNDPQVTINKNRLSNPDRVHMGDMEKEADDNYPIIPAEFLFLSGGSKPAYWYITRLSLTMK